MILFHTIRYHFIFKIMHELSNSELYEAIEYARNIDESAGQNILNNFHLEQPALAEAIFNIFPALIAEQNREMSNMFMELCFDTLCVYQYTFGNAPPQTEECLERQVALMDAEFQALIPENEMNPKIRTKLKNRFSDRAFNENTQVGLIKVLNESIDEYASENISRVPFIKFTQTMIFAVVRLFSNLYSEAAKK